MTGFTIAPFVGVDVFVFVFMTLGAFFWRVFHLKDFGRDVAARALGHVMFTLEGKVSDPFVIETQTLCFAHSAGILAVADFTIGELRVTVLKSVNVVVTT